LVDIIIRFILIWSHYQQYYNNNIEYAQTLEAEASIIFIFIIMDKTIDI